MKALQSIGLESMFSPGEANFSGIVSAGDIFVSDVFQKAFIKVSVTSDIINMSIF